MATETFAGACEDPDFEKHAVCALTDVVSLGQTSTQICLTVSGLGCMGLLY